MFIYYAQRTLMCHLYLIEEKSKTWKLYVIFSSLPGSKLHNQVGSLTQTSIFLIVSCDLPMLRPHCDFCISSCDTTILERQMYFCLYEALKIFNQCLLLKVDTSIP